MSLLFFCERMKDNSQGRICGKRTTFGSQETHVSMLGEFAHYLAVHRTALVGLCPQHGTSSNVPTHVGVIPQIPASQSVDFSGGDVTTDRSQTASLNERPDHDSNIERCCQIRKPLSQEIGIPVLLLHLSKT